MPAIPSQGVTIKISVPGSPTQLLAVAQITGFQLQGSAPEIDTSDLDSLAATLLIGIPKWSANLNFNLDPDNGRHQELRRAIENRTRLEFQFGLTDATPSTATAGGYLTSWQIGGNVNEKVAGSCAIAVDGGILWA